MRAWLSQKRTPLSQGAGLSRRAKKHKIKQTNKPTHKSSVGGMVSGEKMLEMTTLHVYNSAEEAFRKEHDGGREEDIS